jgi:hypothetical protein
MINIQKRHCDVPDCREPPTHNFQGLKPLYCLAHADTSIGHVNVKYSARGSTAARAARAAQAAAAKTVGGVSSGNNSRKHSRDAADEDDQEAAYNRRLQYHQEQQQLQWQQQRSSSSSVSAYASSTEGTTAEHGETEGYDSGSSSAQYNGSHRGAGAAAAAGGSEDCFARRPAQRSCSMFSSDSAAGTAARDRFSSTSSTETFQAAVQAGEEDAVAVRGIISLRHSPSGGSSAVRRVTPAPSALLISSGRSDNNTRRSAPALAAVEPDLSVPGSPRSSGAVQSGGAWTAPSLGQWFAPAAGGAGGGAFDSRLLPSFRSGALDSSRLLPLPVFETAVAVAPLQQQQQQRYPTINGLLQSLGLSNEVTAGSMRCTPTPSGLHTGAAQYF